MEEPPLTRTKLQQMLQTIVQKFGWTYSLFWKFCPQQGLLVWGDGHYNGSIKTRKMVQPTEENSEAPPVDRSEQLKELYEFLAADRDSFERRRPGLALSPEDLTECEWFYLMCISFSFAPGCGLPGKAFETRNYIWLARANNSNSKVFSRTILAKSAGIQTVVCIPLTNGVLELGTAEMVKEDTSLTRQAINIFADIYINLPTPALSEHSTSRPVFQCETLPMNHGAMDGPCQECEEEINYENEGSNNGESAECETKKAFSDSELEIGRNISVQTNFLISMTESENIKFGFADNGAGDSEKFHLKILEVAQRFRTVHSSDRDDKKSYLAGFHQHSPEASIFRQLSYSDSSSFSMWFSEDKISSKTKTSQWMLKYILFILPTHNKKYLNSAHLRVTESGGWKRNVHDETNGNHVLAERRRREKLNNRFTVLRASVPCVTKMDKASILADTIEYVRQLTQRIHNLESQNKKISNLLGSKVSNSHNQINSEEQRLETNCRTLSASISKQELAHLPETKRLRTLQSTNYTEKAIYDSSIRIKVSIIESTAVLGLQCPYNDGILLKIIQKLCELNLDTTYINSTMVNANFIAEFKVKKLGGKRANAGEIQWAIQQLLSH